jgi:predicted nucleic acid-binding protein
LEALTDLFSIPLEVVPPALVSATATLQVASLHGLSYYDATYVGLDEMLDCPLITADRRLAQRARDTGHVRLLGAV